MRNGLINDINKQINIIDVASHYFDIKKYGNVYRARCIHGEDEPSLTFFPTSNTFYCFGCKAGEKNNNIVGFIEWIENCSEETALNILKDKFKVKIDLELAPEYKKIQDEISILKKKLQNNEEAINYLLQRGYTRETINKWNLGYNNGIIYPIANENGIYVGFSKRQLNELPKYINSKESNIFQKRKILYGLDKARKLIRDKKYLVIVEGYNDAIILQQYNIPAVALMGTSLTNYHVELIQKYNISNIILFLDGDPAGITNTEKIVNILKQYNIQTYILNIFSLDPDDFANQYKNETENKIKENMKPWYMYFYDKALDEYKNKLYKANISLQASVNEITEKLTNEEKDIFFSLYKKSLNEMVDLLT